MQLKAKSRRLTKAQRTVLIEHLLGNLSQYEAAKLLELSSNMLLGYILYQDIRTRVRKGELDVYKLLDQ